MDCDETKKQVDNKVDEFKAFAELANHIIKALGKCFEFVKGLRASSCEEITYSDLIAEIVNSKPNDPYVKGCCVLRKKLTDQHIELTIVYLDDTNEPIWGDNPSQPYGFRKRTKNLNQELISQFGDSDMLLIK